jgi:hypothetical protein
MKPATHVIGAAVIAASATALSATVSAAVSDSEFAQMRADFAALAQRLNALEAENARLKANSEQVAMVRESKTSASWTETLKWKGDFRYRYEDIEQDGKDDRERNRIRARAELVARPTDTTEVGLGMASGGDDPVSTNQTLGGGGSTKDLKLDLAYFKWTGIENMYLQAGKFKNPFYKEQKSGLIWDGDFRPEGAAIGWANDRFFATASYEFIEGDSRNDDDGMFGVQVGGKFSLSDRLMLTAAAMYLDIPTRGREAIIDDDFFGNSSVNGEYLYDYKLVNLSLGLGFSLFELPMTAYADYVENDDADDLDTGYLAGIKLGKAKKQGSWQFQYQYQDLEADATFGLVTDSDFMGGGTDGEGHKFSGKYMLNDKWYLGATYFDGNTGVDLGDDADYQRLQLDTGFKY